MKKNKSIRSRIIIGFVFLAFLIALTFSLFNFLLIYVVEDAFIDSVLKEEGERLERGIPYHPEVIQWFKGITSELGIPYRLPST